jgi:hypothetical protein
MAEALDSGKNGFPGAGFLESCDDSYYDYLRIITDLRRTES